MHEVNVTISAGSCTVAGKTSGELKEMSLITKWKADEYDKRMETARSKTEKEGILRQKAKAISKLYFEHLATFITNHNFKCSNNAHLGKFLAGLSEDDVQLIEVGANEGSGVTPEEASDLQGPSGTKESQRPKQ